MIKKTTRKKLKETTRPHISATGEGKGGRGGRTRERKKGEV